MKILYIIFISFLMGIKPSFAQERLKLSDKMVFEDVEDFQKYEPKVILCAKWLVDTALNVGTDNRKIINSFILQWMSGVPYIEVEISEPIQKIIGKNDNLLPIYLSNYASYLLRNKDNNIHNAIKSGLIAMMKVYSKKINIIKNPEMDKILILDKETSLNTYIDKSIMKKFKVSDQTK